MSSPPCLVLPPPPKTRLPLADVHTSSLMATSTRPDHQVIVCHVGLMPIIAALRVRAAVVVVSHTPSRTAARMEPPPEAPSELAQLLELVIALPPETHILVLHHLPDVELARLSCVHKSLLVA